MVGCVKTFGKKQIRRIRDSCRHSQRCHSMQFGLMCDVANARGLLRQAPYPELNFFSPFGFIDFTTLLY